MAVFGVGCGHVDYRRVAVQVETSRGQCPQFVGPESRPESHSIESGAVGADHPEHRRARVGGPDQAALLVGGQSAANTPAVEVGVRRFQTVQPIISGTLVQNEPEREPHDGPRVVKNRSERGPLFSPSPLVPNGLQGGLDSRRDQVGDPPSASQVD
jgi:hypothetical protein